MISRRRAIGVLGSLVAGPLFANTPQGSDGAIAHLASPQDDPPPLAPGAPMSAERLALIGAFKAQSARVDEQFEARTYLGEWAMPYRLFRPAVAGPMPLVVYLHGSGGLGSDNLKQMGLGNVFGTRVCALPHNQVRFPCYVAVPQTDRGWAQYGPPVAGDSVSTVVPGLGEGARAAFAIIDRLCGEFAIDRRRIYVTGQSMGGLGVWNMLEQRPGFFAAAVPCCGSAGSERASAIVPTPIWNFHGDADKTVPVAASRERMAVLRKAGGHPHHTEYTGVGHNVWEWAYTEPALLPWMFSKHRAT